MKLLLISAFVAASLLSAGAAQASADAAQKACGKCHDMEKKKKGPSYKAMAAKFKGDEAAVIKAMDPKGDHPEVKAKDDEIKAAVKWMLEQK